MNRFSWLSTLRPKALDLWRHGRRRIHPPLDRAKGKLWLFAGIVSIAAILWGIDHYWDWPINDPWIWLGATPDGRESNSSTLRNVGLVAAGAIAFGFAYWRAKVADRQATAAQHQADTARLQSEIAQRGLLNERYQKGAEMLGSDVPSVRLGGIYTLRRLAEEHPEEYHVQIMHLFCAFVRNPTETKGGDERWQPYETPHRVTSLREDVQAVMMAIGNRSSEHLNLESQARLQLDMQGADLRGAELREMNLTAPPWQVWPIVPLSELLKSRTDLSYARLCSARLAFANLKNANLTGSCLCSALLPRTDLSGATLVGTNLHGTLSEGPILSGAKFSYDGRSPAKGIKQSDLDSCQADADNLPDLTGVVDAETGEPLVWTGKPLDDKST